MGTINYCTSDYITIGQQPLDLYELENNPDFMHELRECYELQPDEDATAAIYDYIEQVTQDDFANLENIIDKYSFYYYHIAVKSGYYEGFYLDIENNFPVCFDDYREKREAQKEITQIKAFLTECAGIGLVSVYPGWCTGYADHQQTLDDIKKAVQEMREEAKTTPTWAQYNR